MEEVLRQMQPLKEAVADLKRQNDTQSAMLDKVADSLRKAQDWCTKFWSNGSGGPLGWMENRVAMDDARYTVLASDVAEIKADSLREDGKKALRVEMWTKIRRVAMFAVGLGGTGGYFLHPMLHSIAQWLEQVTK